jgi:D-amino-acid dehydrogenase
MELAGIDFTINERRVGALLKSIPKYIANLHPAEMPRELTWSGLRPLSPDGLPYIGRFERCSNLIAATGHAMIGLSTGPITGKLVAELISGPATSLPIHALRPDRF